MGSVGCAILPALHRLGYTASARDRPQPAGPATGARDAVDYRVGDLTRTPWPDGHFAAITSISVIEHGVPDEKLLAEVGRLLRPGGVFLFSTDYWPDKIDTSEIRLFDLDWTIFSAEEIDAFVATAPGPADWSRAATTARRSARFRRARSISPTAITPSCRVRW